MLYISLVKMLWALVHCKECSVNMDWAGLSCVHYSLKALCDIMRQSELTTSCKARAEMARGIFYLMTFNPDCLQRVNSITRISGVNQQIVHLKSINKQWCQCRKWQNFRYIVFLCIVFNNILKIIRCFLYSPHFLTLEWEQELW